MEGNVVAKNVEMTLFGPRKFAYFKEISKRKNSPWKRRNVTFFKTFLWPKDIGVKD